MKQLCVFCGSSDGSAVEFRAAAEETGRELARRQIGLVYGGGGIGLMGQMADACLADGGRVVGVLPHAMRRREWGHTGLTELHLVETMHQRKALMNELSDGFLALPGGIGTLEEFFEAWTWAQLGVHRKPCGLLNIEGYFDRLLEFLNEATDVGFVSMQVRQMIVVETDIATLLDRMLDYQPPQTPRWLAESDT